jgi:hypothetical protein
VPKELVVALFCLNLFDQPSMLGNNNYVINLAMLHSIDNNGCLTGRMAQFI